jgi:transcriptional regulator with XRE-family HTH domain
MTTSEQRQELAAFLRARRHALRPIDIALSPDARRRRTPGLRREEVAELAGIGASWYTRLEQGKDVRLSPRALRGIAEALRLTPAQREYVFALARGEELGVRPAPTITVSATLQDVLDAQGDNPAYVTDGRLNLLAWNRAALEVFGVFGRSFHDIPPEERNVVWLIFTDDSRRLLLDWEQHAQRVLAQFRDASRHFVDDPWFPAFVDRLKRRSGEFAAWWSQHDVGRIQATEKVIDHPAVGPIALTQTVLQVVDDRAPLYAIIYTPAPGTDAAEKLAKLAGA